CEVPDSEKLPHQLYPWQYQAPGYESFDNTNVINTPDVGVLAQIVTITAPIGWDGVINRIAHGFLGGTFQEGTGDLIWRILLNSPTVIGQPIKNYGALITSFGSVNYPREISGFILRSGQTAYYVVDVENDLLVGGTRIFATFSGYFWRNQ